MHAAETAENARIKVERAENAIVAIDTMSADLYRRHREAIDELREDWIREYVAARRDQVGAQIRFDGAGGVA